jgi:MGT family glycosyltransferase
MAAGGILFVTWSGGGNVPPVVALAQRLLDRGHDARVLASEDLAGRFAEAGIPFRAYRADEAWKAGLADDVLAEIRRAPTDVVVVDYMQPMALCAAEATTARVVALVHTLFTNVALGELSPMRMAAGEDALNSVRARLDLAPVAPITDLLHNADRVLVSSTRELDGPSAPDPANLRYVGPIVENPGVDRDWEPPWPDEAPLVHVSLGSTPMDEGPLLQTSLAALDGLPVHVFATVGAHLDPASLRPPANAVVARPVRHAALMPHTSLFVTHAGLGGIGAALTYGVPMLCIPLGREQPANAARVEAIGAGRTLGRDATVADLRCCVTEMLEDDRSRASAAAAARTVRELGAGARAIEEIEQLLP